VDAIVNAANTSLLGGGGVDGAIHRAAGPQLLEYCRTLNGCATGQAKITPGFRLPARWVIHTVGPIWRGGKLDEDRLLAACYKNSLKLAQAHQLQSIAFPSISTGVYGFPKDRAASIATEVVVNFLQDNELEVWFVCFDSETYHLYTQLLSVRNVEFATG